MQRGTKRKCGDDDDGLGLIVSKKKKTKETKTKQAPPGTPLHPADLQEFRQKNLHVLGDGTIEVKTSTLPDAGNGLFALVDFKKGDPITEYTGYILSFEEVKESVKLNPFLRSHMRDLFSMRWVIDGACNELLGDRILDINKERKGKGVAAFANDPYNERKQRVNAVFDMVDSKEMDLSDPHWSDRIVFLRASKDIPKGSEIFVSYGPRYWK